jgi:hypothetical protein
MSLPKQAPNISSTSKPMAADDDGNEPQRHRRSRSRPSDASCAVGENTDDGGKQSDDLFVRILQAKNQNIRRVCVL